jgi:hypothetical protein
MIVLSMEGFMSEKKSEENKPFWQSTKFIYAVLALAAFLALTLSGTVVFTPEQTMNFLLGIFGINVGAHATTNIAAIIGQFFGKKGTEVSVERDIEPVVDEDARITPVETPVPRGKDE